jgi:Tol biopolymer transport system component
VFESTREGASDLWSYELSSKAFTRITQMPGGARMPVWAPAGGAR